MEKTFLQPQWIQRGIPVSVDSRIREEVIDRRVMVDCNLFGGMEAVIPLESLTPERMDPFTAIYRIPKDMTQGRTITTVYSASFGENTRMPGANVHQTNNSHLMGAAGEVLDGAMEIPNVSTAYVQLIGENTVLIEGQLSLPSNIFLRCMLTHDQEMSSIKPSSYHAFSRLVVLATKAHIYQQNMIRMDMGQLHAGMQLGTFKEIIDEYADANELYYTHLQEVWRSTATLNDEERRRRHLKMLVGGGR